MAELPTPSDLAMFLDFTFDANDALRAQQLIDFATAEAGNHVGLSFGLTTVTDEVARPEPIRRRLILLRHRPIVLDSETVEVDGETFDGTYDLDHYTGELWRVDGTLWPLPWQERVTVTYTHGTAADGTDVPDGVPEVVLQRAAMLWVNPEASMQRRRGDASTAFASSADEATGLTPSMKTQLERAMG
jgi:hypothetical protein